MKHIKSLNEFINNKRNNRREDNKLKPTLFLDFDGVVKPYNNKRTKGEFFDKQCIKALNEIIDATDCNIVISSNWRYDYKLEGLEKLFRKNGINKVPIDVTNRKFGKTTTAADFYNIRGDEITDYVKKNNIKVWCAVDDYELKLPKENFVKTKETMGISEDGMIDKIINKLLIK